MKTAKVPRQMFGDVREDIALADRDTTRKPRGWLDSVSTGDAALRSGILILLAAALLIGWYQFRFLTDDAFITFRYIDHHRRGWGYTWNPPPFQPVEGYSNFLWAVLLEAIWAVTGATPPATANVVSLLLSYASLAVGFSIVWRMDFSDRWRRHRFWLACLALLYAISNRTFITWTSSGLETALFGFCTAVWLLGVVELGRRPNCRALTLASAGAASAALTRPDGLLLVMATLFLGAYLAIESRRVLRPLLCSSPLLAVAVHLLWRRWYYQAWVPNTYYAKQVTAWPDAGVR
jgi:arabinofuranosyltransferase